MLLLLLLQGGCSKSESYQPLRLARGEEWLGEIERKVAVC